MHLLECIWLPLHVHLGGGDYHNWALLTLSRENYLRYRECSGRRRSLEADFKKKARLCLDIYFVKHVL